MNEITIELTVAAMSLLKEEAEKQGQDVAEVARSILLEWILKQSVLKELLYRQGVFLYLPTVEVLTAICYCHHDIPFYRKMLHSTTAEITISVNRMLI